MSDKKADLAGPGIGDYAELEKILPQDYSSLLDPKETQQAVTAMKEYIEGKYVQGTQPDKGDGSFDCRC